MAYYAPTSDALVRPWRTRAVVLGTIALAELLALVGLGIAYFGQSWFAEAKATAVHRAQEQATAKLTKAVLTPAPEPSPAAAPAKLTRAKTRILVLNGNGRNGAAAAEARAIKARGYRVAAVGNAKRSDYGHSVVMYRSGFRPEAIRLAHDLRLSIVTPLDGLWPKQLEGAQLALIVGR